MKRIINMRQMSVNQKGIIKKISAKGEMGRRIREMGLVPETPIQIQGRAPLKDPVAVKVRDFALAKTKFKIRELIEVIKEECGFNLTLDEVRRVLRAIFNCVIRGVKKLGDNAIVEIKKVNKEFKMLYEIIKQDINCNSVEKCERVIEEKIKENSEGIYETELYEWVVKELKFVEEVFDKALEKLKNLGVIYEPKPGLLRIL